MNIPLRQYWNLLARYLRAQWGWVAALAVLLFGNIGLQLVNPQIMRRFLDVALAGQGGDLLTTLAVWFIAIAVTQQITAVSTTYVSENISWTATNWLRYDLARHCLHLDLTFHNSHTPGEMIERIDGDVNTLSTFFSQFVLQIVGNGLLMTGILVLLFAEDVRIGLAITLFVVVALGIIGRLRNIGVPYFTAARQASANFYSFLEERLAGTEEIRASGAQAYVMRRFFDLVRQHWLTSVKARVASASMINAAWTLITAGNAVAFVVGAALYQRGELSLGGVYILFHYTNMLGRPIESIFREFETFQQAGAGIARIQEVLQVESRLADSEQYPVSSEQWAVNSEQWAVGSGQWAVNSEQLAEATSHASRFTFHASPSSPLSVSFENVSFVYPDDAPDELILRGVSFQLSPGRVLGLLGRTGSGKTTLIRLLFRLYDVSQGAVCLDGADVRQVPLPVLRGKVGMVTQNVQLFNASIRDNLTFFDGSIPDEQILAVLQDLGLQPWLNSHPAGLHTVLTSSGGGLSAGEAQLLAFARVFLKNPGLVILDEASSRLDPATEQLIEQAISKLLNGRTAIIIAHRLGTVERADEILILENGRILEHAPRQQLATNPNSRFYQLLQTGIEELLA